MTSEDFKDWRIDASSSKKAAFCFRLFVGITIFLIIAIGLDYWIHGQLGAADKFLGMAKDNWSIGVLIAGGSIYILLLSLPFVPGVELGILLMCTFGKEGIVFVYIATVTGLIIAFLMGRMLPKRMVMALSEKLGFPQPGGNRSDEINFLLGNFFDNKKWRSNLLSKFRYPAIAVLLNMPGSNLIGGGGGIAFSCGISRNISFKLFLLTVVLAVSPVPLFAFFGVLQIEAILH
jgi:hypothetical protein